MSRDIRNWVTPFILNTPLRFHIQLATWRVFNPYSAVKSITAEYQSIFGSKLQLPNINPYSAVKSNWRLSDEWQTANNQNHRIIKYKGILISFFLSLVFKTGKLVEWRKKENKYQSSEEAVDYVFCCLDTFLIQWSPWLYLSSFAPRRAAYEMTKNLNWPRDSNVFHAGMVNLQSHDTFRMSTVYFESDEELFSQDLNSGLVGIPHSSTLQYFI